MKAPDFTSIDFETASGARNSACSVGIVRFESGMIVSKKHYLIKPPYNEYFYRNTMIHGISPITTENAPTFDLVWNKIAPLIENQTVVAHNSSFDKSVLEKSLAYYNIPVPNVNWQCTYKITGDKLITACAKNDINIYNHHNALDDALACGELFLKFLKGEIIQIKSISTDYNSNHSNKRRIDKRYIKPDLTSSNKQSHFYNKHVVISGVFKHYSRNEIAKILHDQGALNQSSVNSKTDYVLAGANMGPAKKEKAEKLGITIITEDDFEKMIQQTSLI
jgi:DNA polymerase-3 subunit epsilon